jgi:hypothetical protein
MNIFPTNIQYFLLKHFENEKRIIKIYTDPDYENKYLIGYYYPGKIVQENIEIDKYLFTRVSRCGNIRLMKWFYENGCPWNVDVFECAAEHGSLENMKWLKANGCPWDEFTFEVAARHGNLENMKWLKANGCPWGFDTFDCAVKHGNLEMIQWLKENGCLWNANLFL